MTHREFRFFHTNKTGKGKEKPPVYCGIYFLLLVREKKLCWNTVLHVPVKHEQTLNIELLPLFFSLFFAFFYSFAFWQHPLARVSVKISTIQLEIERKRGRELREKPFSLFEKQVLKDAWSGIEIHKHNTHLFPEHTLPSQADTPVALTGNSMRNQEISLFY